MAKELIGKKTANIIAKMLLLNYKERRIRLMKTSNSVRGVQHKKIVPVKPYTKSDGTKVSGHRRSTPK